MGKGRSNNGGSNTKQTKRGEKATTCSHPKPMKKELMRAKNINATIMILRNFLSPQDITSIRQCGPTGTLQNHDRSEELDFEHIVYRFETPLKHNNGKLYDRLLDAMVMADDELWRGIPAAGTPAHNWMHLEIEFISYDADLCSRRGGRHPYIGPHVDNASAVTLIGQLSQFRDGDASAIPTESNHVSYQCKSSTSQGKKGGKKVSQKQHNGEDRGYEGGHNRFEIGGAEFSRDADDGGIAKGLYRQTRLNKGDVLMFRGEMLEHSLTAVTAGLRQIVQIELCREKEGRH
mmetsp:Transcript_4188/g.7785  ORF Transcript_4188/g.7785 Transcript_4188/m.7785 type:complete len:290 (-) Transcript_4188:276-1145(-)